MPSTSTRLKTKLVINRSSIDADLPVDDDCLQHVTSSRDQSTSGSDGTSRDYRSVLAALLKWLVGPIYRRHVRVCVLRLNTERSTIVLKTAPKRCN